MYRQVYITLAVLVLSGHDAVSFLARSLRSAETCPVIVVKSDSDCVGLKSECWSPNQYDVDCDNGSEVCCFNGCVNVCGRPKACQTVYQTRYENVTKQMCLPVEQPSFCQTLTSQDCHDDCKNVDLVIPTTVEENVCNTIYEPVCTVNETETCVPPEFVQTSPKCPLIHLKPVEACHGQEPSNCWSPGVPDVDCENNGLCCFNGCANRCVKNCFTETATECQTVEEEQCQELEAENCSDVQVTVPCEEECTSIPEEVCKDVVEQVCKDEVVQNCTNVSVPVVTQVSEIKCVSITVPECVTVFETVCTGSKVDSYRPYECKKVPKENCKDVIQQDCKPEVSLVTEYINQIKCEPYVRPVCAETVALDCREIDTVKCITKEGCSKKERKCETVRKNVCTRVPKEECKQVSKEVCPECVKKILRSEKCTSVPKEVCNKVTKTVEKSVANEVCNQVCEPKTEEKCIQVEPKIECNNIVKLMSYPVPVLSCQQL